MFCKKSLKFIASLLVFCFISFLPVFKNYVNALQVSPSYLSEEIFLGEEAEFSFSIEGLNKNNIEVNLVEWLQGKSIYDSELIKKMERFVKIGFEEKEVLMTVSPESVEDAGYFQFYLEIVEKVSSTTVKQNNFIGAQARILVPVLLNIYADRNKFVPPAVNITESVFNPSIFIYNNSTAVIDVQNTSKYFVIPRGVVKLTKNIGIGRHYIEGYLNQFNNIVLPNSHRSFDVNFEINDAFVLGIYDVNITVVSGKDNHVLEHNSSKLFVGVAYIIPIGIIFLFLAYKFIFSKILSIKRR